MTSSNMLFETGVAPRHGNPSVEDDRRRQGCEPGLWQSREFAYQRAAVASPDAARLPAEIASVSQDRGHRRSASLISNGITSRASGATRTPVSLCFGMVNRRI